MMQEKPTFCRICEPGCPMLAEFDDAGALTGLKPHYDDPIGGIPCHKGLSYLEVHDDPDRLNNPQRRLNARNQARGDFDDITWDDAFSEIARKIHALIDQHGPNSIAFYLGNCFAFNGAALMLASSVPDAIGTQMRFGANSQDAANRAAAFAPIFGAGGATPAPDIYNTDYLLCVGGNPKVSRWTGLSTPNDPDVLKKIKQRGGKIRFVNPRKIETSTEETGPTLLIKPGTDVYFLAALLNEIEARGGFDQDILEKRAKNVEGLRRFIAGHTAERSARVTGISAEQVREIATEFLAAKSAIIHPSTGVNQSRQGILCVWLVAMIHLVTGNLGRIGGVYKPDGLSYYLRPTLKMVEVETSLGTFTLPDPIGYACLPAVLLPELIESGDIRAFINLGGNPLLSIGGEDKMRAAFEKLDLLVSLDIYRNATGEMADYLLPSTDWLERPDLNLLNISNQTFPHARYTEAMVVPAADRKNDWWIMARLAQALGLPSPLDDNPEDKTGVVTLDVALAASGLSVEALLAAPTHVVRLLETERDSFFERCVLHADKKIDCCPPSFAASGLFDRCDAIFDELISEPAGSLKLISFRTPYIHNSWLANSEKFRRGKQASNPLNICEQDAVARGLYNGDAVRVSTDYGSIETAIFINNDLRPGAVAMSHGFGHRAAFGLSVARENAGANCNAIMPTGPGTFEPLSNMSWLSGVPVQVEKLQLGETTDNA